MMYGDGKSHRLIVPAKPSNKAEPTGGQGGGGGKGTGQGEDTRA